MPRGRSATYDDQRELILAQAAQLFARRGYPATSMNQVAEACNLSKATLYHYYKDKSSLLISIAETHVSKLAARRPKRRAIPPTKRARLDLPSFEQMPGAQGCTCHAATRPFADEDRERVLDQERHVVAGFARAVAEHCAAARRRATASSSKPLTMLLFGMINWMFTWMKPDGRLDDAGHGRRSWPTCSWAGWGVVKLPPAAPSESAKESG